MWPLWREGAFHRLLSSLHRRINFKLDDTWHSITVLLRHNSITLSSSRSSSRAASRAGLRPASELDSVMEFDLYRWAAGARTLTLAPTLTVQNLMICSLVYNLQRLSPNFAIIATQKFLTFLLTITDKETAANTTPSSRSSGSNNFKPGTERLQALADISRSRYVVIATKPVHRLQIRQTVHN